MKPNILSNLDSKMLALGKCFKIVLPEGKGEPLYTCSLFGAIEMAKEYGKGTKVIDLNKRLNDL